MARRKAFDIETSEAIGRRIRNARGAASQEDFAAAIGVSRSALTNYEAGRRLPNDEVLARIAQASGVPTFQLLFDQPKVAFADYQQRIEKAALEAAARRPGFIPRFMVSDDEYAFIALFRLMQQETAGREMVRSLVTYWREVLKASETSPFAPPIEWGEAHLTRLEAAVERGALEEGFDPQQALWATFWEERHAGK